MSEYYAVQRSGNELHHYGVRGMKWGVKKAVAKGSERSLNRQYRKAAKKLAKLEAKADAQKLNARASKYDKASKVASRVGHVGLGAATAGTGLHVLQGYMRDKALNKYNRATGDILSRKSEARERWLKGQSGYYDPGKFNRELDYARDRIDQVENATGKARDIARGAQKIGAGAAVAGYGTAIGTKIKAASLRRKAKNAKYLKKANAKAAAFRSEMSKAFAGTKYAGKPRQGRKRRK